MIHWRESLAARERQMRLLSPEATLKRGYAMALDAGGKLVRDASSARKQKELRIRFADGEVRVQPES